VPHHVDAQASDVQLTVIVQQEIAEQLTEPEAAAAAGIGLRTLGRWLARGDIEAFGPYCALLLDCQEAIAAYRAELGTPDLDALFGVVPPEGARLWTSNSSSE
jgi:hypothetical protein